MSFLSRRTVNRTPGQQLALLGLAGFALIALIMAALSWASGISTSDTAVDPRTKTITLALSQEPPSLDSTLDSDSISSFILGHVMEGLLRYDEHNQVAPGVAERWNITATGATFWLRPDAKWSDGKPVTAHDFVFAWRHVVDPASGSRYANIMYGIKNAQAINEGKMPPDTLGVQAVGDRELRVEFENPIPYFAQLMTFNVFYPIRKDFYDSTNGTYAADADKLLYNGPYKITLWVHGAHIRLDKNPDYWNRDAIHVNTIDFPYFTSDPGAIINLFRDGKIASTGLSEQNLKEAQMLRWNIKSAPTGAVSYLAFNFMPGHPTRNLNLRRAIQYAISPEEMINKVLKIPGQVPATSLFPAWLDGVHGKFTKEFPPEKIVPDPVKARHYLALAKQQLGVDKIPPLMLLTDDVDLANRIAQYYQSTLKRTLGLDVRIDLQTFKQRIAKQNAGDFDMAMAGWLPDYNDPLTYGDLFYSTNGNNTAHFDSPALDAQVDIARSSNDPMTRMRAFAAIQHILIDQAVILPTYESTTLYVVNPGITGIVRRVNSPNPDYTHVTFTGK